MILTNDGLPYVTEENPGTTYDYQIEEGVCGVLFNYYSNNDSASGHIDLYTAKKKELQYSSGATIPFRELSLILIKEW